MSNKNRYTQLIERMFKKHYTKGASEVSFKREDLVETANELGIKLPKNLGDIIYSFRYRTELPASIRKEAPKGLEWIIRPMGQSQYKFALASSPRITPNPMLSETKIPDATPGIIASYALNDEQALLAKLRYNRLIDIFTGITCYSLQNHLRTTVRGIGQIETDELYVGVDLKGIQYILPVQGKGGSDQLNIVQIEQDIAMCLEKFPHLVCIPTAAQFMDENLIALFSFEEDKKGVSILSEKHYRLVPHEELSNEELLSYRNR
ncbi:MAG: hypothetical protein P1P89_16780 [Desulfobacterales bacterium]|nr:hypothetical protein [Desulfobacterales bacterium]